MSQLIPGASAPSLPAPVPAQPLIRTVTVIEVEERKPSPPPFRSFRYDVRYRGGILLTDEFFHVRDQIQFTTLPDGRFSYVRIPASTQLKELVMNELKTIPNHPLTMSSIEIAELVKKRHDNVKRTIETLAESGVITLPQIEEKPDTGGRPGTFYVFDLAHKRDSFVVVAQLSPEFTAALVDRWQELENQASPIALPKSYVAALEQLVSEVKAKEAAEARALEAERTKAQIGSKREATAMNLASQEAKRAHKLEIELDKAKDYATVKRMQLLCHGQKFNWRLLRDTSNAMGIPTADVFDANYGTVKAYHRDVWQEAYALDIQE